MSRLLALAALLVAGTFVPVALGVRLPTLPTPTVTVPTAPVATVPTVPVATVTTPVATVTTPTLPPPPTVPPPTTAVTVRPPTAPPPARRSRPRQAQPRSAPQRSSPAGTSGQPAAGAPAATWTGSRGAGRAGSASSPHASRSRTRPRPVVTRFRLPRRTQLRVLVREQAPTCRLLGRYLLRPGRGRHVLRLPHTVRGHRLRAGTYRFLGTTSAGREVLDVRVRLVRRKDRLVVRRDRLADTCAVPTEAVLVTGPPTSPQPGAAKTAGSRSGHPAQPKPTPPPAGSTQRTASPPFLPPALRTGSPLVRAILFALLGAAVLLLAAGSVPDRAVAGSRVAGAVSRNRAVITVAGIVLLAAAVLVMLLG